jgi:hypothetical protein
MRPEAEAMLRFLLQHHRHVCVAQGRTALRDCTTTYGVMCREAGVLHLVRRTGPFLYEVAEWCLERDLPPINALVVLDDEGLPGDAYAEAPGCSLANWINEAEEVIRERRYPEDI